MTFIRDPYGHGALALLATVLAKGPWAIAASSQSGHVYVGCSGAEEVLVLAGRMQPQAGMIVNRIEAHFPNTIVVDEDTQCVYVADYNGRVTVIDDTTGSVAQTIEVAADPSSLVVCKQAALIAVIHQESDTLSILDSRSQSLQRTLTLSTRLSAAAVSDRTNRLFCIGEADDQSTVVDVVDLATFRLLYTVAIDQYSPLAIAVSDTTGRAFGIAHGSGPHGNVSILDTGATSPSTSLLGIVRVGECAGVIGVHEGGGRVFVGCGCDSPIVRGDDEVSTLHARDGRVLSTTHVGGRPNAIAVNRRAGRVFVACGKYGHEGSVSALDATTGVLQGSIVTGEQALDVAVDEVTGRVYVANYSGNTISILDGARLARAHRPG